MLILDSFAAQWLFESTEQNEIKQIVEKAEKLGKAKQIFAYKKNIRNAIIDDSENVGGY